jgi:universal bacterial protein yeaZ
LLEKLVQLSGDTPVVIVGDGLKRLEKEYALGVEEGRIDPIRLVIGHESKQRPRASHVIQVALPQFVSGTIPDAQSIEPFYIRKSEAEVVWDEKNKDILATGNYVEPTVVVREAAGER